MFIQACFIRKNTPELRKKLEELGILAQQTYGTNKSIFVWINESGIKRSQSISLKEIPHAQSLYPDAFDCGDNEELFLALAALRDDSDYAQWFICEDYGVPVFEQCNKLYAMSDFIISHWTDYHKATKEELIEYFKTK